MKQVTIVLLIAVLMVGGSAFAQTMKMHYGDDVLRISMSDMDSLTFSQDDFRMPAYIQIDHNPVGEDEGGALWSIDVLANLSDINAHTVMNGLPVAFSISPPGFVSISDAYTGNMSGPGMPLDGIAATKLLYHSSHTNEVFQVTATYYRQGEPLVATYDLILPVQDPSGVVLSNPANFNFARHGDEWAAFEIQGTIYDGHGYAVGGQRVLFVSQFGAFYDTDQLPPVGEPSAYGETDGDATVRKYLVLSRAEAFPDPTNPVNNCSIQMHILGFEDAGSEPVTVFLYNY